MDMFSPIKLLPSLFQSLSLVKVTLALSLAWGLTCQNLEGHDIGSGEQNIQSYLEFYRKHYASLGPDGNHREGEIQLIVDPKLILQIQDQQKELLIKKGMSPTAATLASRVGIISEDRFWLFLRDAVIFPSGTKGLYNRIVPQSSLSGLAGVAIAPLLPDGRVIMILNYRHATRSWEVELPRGGRADHETIEQAAVRETIEETGYRLQNPTLLGVITPDSGITSARVAVMAGFALEKKPTNLDESEAIKGIIALSKAQIREAYVKGYLEIQINNQTRRVVLQDPFIAYALIVAEEKGLW